MTEEGNQTHFAYEEPLFEQPPTVPSDEPVKPPVPWYKKKLVLVGIIGGVLFLLLLLLILMQPRRQEPEDSKATPTPSPVANFGPLEARVIELQQELEAADPAKQDLPFPPVNMEMRIPDERRR